LRSIFVPDVLNGASQNVAFSPVGVHFMVTMLKELISAPLYSDWDRLASHTNLIHLNKQLQTNPTITSKSVIAGREWSKSVPTDFLMDHFKVFNSVDVKSIGKYLEADVSELASATGAAVHLLKFNGSWQTKFTGNQSVKFSDGIEYSFMKAIVPSVPWFENDDLTVVTLPFNKIDEGFEDVCIDLILPKHEGRAVDLNEHKKWISNQIIQSKAKIVIPKVKLEYKEKINLSSDSAIESLQKIMVEWDENGVKGEAITMSMARSLPPPIPEFIASRQFLFIIRQEALWLFVGRISSIDASLNMGKRIAYQEL